MPTDINTDSTSQQTCWIQTAPTDRPPRQSQDIVFEVHDPFFQPICSKTSVEAVHGQVGVPSELSSKRPSEDSTVIDIPASASDLRSQSSILCDPNAQGLPTNEGVTGMHSDLSVSSKRQVSASCHHDGTIKKTRAPGTASAGLSRHQKGRRLSWLSVSWSNASMKEKQGSVISIPPATSIFSVGKSSISSPTLTSTTNARVANAENIHYSEALFPTSSCGTARLDGDGVEGESGSNTVAAAKNSSSWKSTVRSIKAKLGHPRRASTSLIPGSSWLTYEPEVWGSTDLSSNPSRRMGRTAIYGDKLHLFGERLHRSTHGAGSDALRHQETVKAKEIHTTHLHNDLSTPSHLPTCILPGLHSDSNTDLLRGSLSKSFASAIDKLDLRSLPTLVQNSPSMSSLRKAKSIFGLRGKYDEKEKTPTKGMFQSWYYELLLIRLQKGTPSSADPMPDLTELSLHAKNKGNVTDTFGVATGPNTSTDESNENISPKPVSGLVGRNHPDPLRSNPTVLPSATPSSQAGPSTTPDLPTQPKVDDEDEDEELYTLREAIMFSESQGNLSQYTRTPSPTNKSVPAAAPARLPDETPTKQPTYQKLKKSVSSFFNKSANKIRSTPTTPAKGQKTGNKQEQQSMGAPDVQVPERATHSHQPYTPSPLRKSSRAMTSSPSAQVPVEGLKLDHARSPNTASNREKRRGMYGEENFKDFRLSRVDITEPYEE